MKPITELLKQKDIQKLTLPANFRYGQAIYERDGVEIIEQTPEYVESWAGGLGGTVKEGGGQRRRARLSSTPKGLTWHCTGNPRDHDIFCKHCVALALFVQGQN